MKSFICMQPAWALLLDSGGGECRAGVRCSTSNPAREVGVLYAGLAPGTIGYYQLSLRLPTALAAFTTRVVYATPEMPEPVH